MRHETTNALADIQAHHRTTAKHNYDERKRLRLENELRLQQRKSADLDHEDEVQRQFTRLLTSFERIADVMELWADKQ